MDVLSGAKKQSMEVYGLYEEVYGLFLHCYRMVPEATVLITLATAAVSSLIFTLWLDPTSSTEESSSEHCSDTLRTMRCNANVAEHRLSLIGSPLNRSPGACTS